MLVLMAMMLDTVDAEVHSGAVVWLTKGLPASQPLSAAGLSLRPLRSPLEGAFAANHHRAQKEQPPIQIFFTQRLNHLWRGALRGPASAYAG